MVVLAEAQGSVSYANVDRVDCLRCDDCGEKLKRELATVPPREEPEQTTEKIVPIGWILLCRACAKG